MMIIDNKFNFWDIVYLKTDVDQEPRIITQISLCPSGMILYQLSCGLQVSLHYEKEITPEKSLIEL